MTLNEATIICGIRVIPVLSEGQAAQLSLTFPDLKAKMVKDKKTGEKVATVQSMAKRAISDVTRFFTGNATLEIKMFLAERQLPTANSIVAAAVKEQGYTPLDFYLGAQALIESLEEEVTSASAADPSNIMGQFLASLLTLEDAIPTQAEVLDLINAKVTAYFADAEKLKEVADLMAEKEAVVGAGRRPDGSLMWRKPRAAKAEAEAPTEEKPGEISA